MTSKTTPMMGQYQKIKKQLPQKTILFFRLGDFYEMFFEDAQIASQILGISLTKRNHIPMCGVPHHASNTYLTKLIRAGQKVAICDQVEEASQAKGIVKRDVTRIVTPGTILEEDVLEANKNNYLAGFYRSKKKYGLALLDLSTGLFWMEEMDALHDLADSLSHYVPSECIYPDSLIKDQEMHTLQKALSPSIIWTPYEHFVFEEHTAHETLNNHFSVHSLEGFGVTQCKVGVVAAGSVLHYVTQELKRCVGHVKSIHVRDVRDFMHLDEATIGHLELVTSRGGLQVGPKATSLLKVLDKTLTPMGGRLLRSWILRPLNKSSEILRRQEVVELFCQDRELLTGVRSVLKEVRDLERLIARLGTSSGNARDLMALASSLEVLPALVRHLQLTQNSLLVELKHSLDVLPDVVAQIQNAIEPEPPVTLKEGGLIRSGYNKELDVYRAAATDGRKWLAAYQAKEQEHTGIKNLKVRHNKVFGYYIEISKSHLNAVPETYIRKQTLVNAERFITPELKEYEHKILGAQDRATELEYELFTTVRQAAIDQTSRIQKTAYASACIDVLSTLSERALALRYIRPTITDGDQLIITQGRHPVIEELTPTSRFVPNDTKLDGVSNQLILITGPNMAGKSTYIRQVALMVIMAQMGSFVPAASAEMGVVDKVFTRVGASDDIARGRSTFMVEMQETANILNHATEKSLIVLDEIGRGTSTFDGISIAWAVAEYLHNHAPSKAKTLFATHYHELTELACTLEGVKNYNVLVREQDDHIVFLHKIVPGAADKSYGIQVARLAGLPVSVISRSKEILKNLEESEFGDEGLPKLAKRRSLKDRDPDSQLFLFSSTQAERE